MVHRSPPHVYGRSLANDLKKASPYGLAFFFTLWKIVTPLYTERDSDMRIFWSRK
jgi:hypothetical protein